MHTGYLPAGYSVTWSGQYEYMERAPARLYSIVPPTLLIIATLLYLSFRNVTEVVILMSTLPFALVGSIWLMYFMDFNFSIAVGAGFIALAGVAVEIGVIMLVYLNQAMAAQNPGGDDLREIVLAGACRRVRPVMMTTATIVLGLLPVLLGGGTGAEVMSRIAAPMVGGMISALVLSLLVLPAVFYVWRR